MSRRLSRRTLLRAGGLAGVAMALPPLEAMFGPRAANAASSGIDRLVIFHFPDGVFMPDWMNTPAGPADPLPDQLQPLAHHRDRLTIVTGLSNVAAGEGCQLGGTPHATPRVSLLTADATVCADYGPSNASVDHVAAQALPPTPRPLLGLRPYKGSYTWHPISFSGPGPGTGINPIARPSIVFDQVFAAGADPVALAAIRARRLSILDFAKDELSDLRRDLGTTDHARLDMYLDGLRDLELRVSASVAQCTSPDAPPSDDADDVAYEEIPARTELLMDLGVLALRCDITRVLTFSVGPTQNSALYPFLPGGPTPTSDVHQLSHQSWSDDKELTAMWYRDMVKYHLSMFARLLDGLLVDGDLGPDLLSRSIVVCASEMSHGEIHHPYNLPVVVGGGGLPGNRVVHYPCRIEAPATSQWGYAKYVQYCNGDTATPLANLWLTVLRTLGSKAASFGESTGTLDGLW